MNGSPLSQERRTLIIWFNMKHFILAISFFFFSIVCLASNAEALKTEDRATLEHNEQTPEKIQQKPVLSSIDVSIDNITTVKAYDMASHFVQHMPGVKKASLNSVTETAVLYTLDIDVSPELIKKQLAKQFISLPEEKNEDILKYRIHS